MQVTWKNRKIGIAVVILLAIALISTCAGISEEDDTIQILNVSYDPTRELFHEYNEWFSDYWYKETAEKVIVRQSHGGSGKQARSVIEGIRADVVTLGLGYDIDAIAERGMINEGWNTEFDYNSSPYYSTIVFLVRKGNPKQIDDWNDLVRADVEVITPNPKTSGGARWNYLGAYAYALKRYQQDEQKAIQFVGDLYRNVRVLDTGARASTTTFVDRNIGDVLISWENEALMAMNEFGTELFEVVNPSISVLAEPPVAIVDRNVKKRGTSVVAKSYLQQLYSDMGQKMVAKHYFRPRNNQILQHYSHMFPEIEMLSIKDFGGWSSVQAKHFADEGFFDKMYSR
jgi:sulfate/thiosulfate-binding protein